MNKRNLLYYLFATFIVAIFLWWWVLLFQKNQNVYQEKKVLYDLIIDIDTSETTRQLYDQEVSRLDEQYQRQRSMITGEGLAFLILLILGIIRLNKYFQKEIALARQQSNFLLSVTHELRSPLASAILNIETLQKRKELPTDKRELLLKSSHSELGRLNELVEKLLLATRIEGRQVWMDWEVVDLSALYSEAYKMWHARWQNDYILSAELEDGLKVTGDAVLLKSIFQNLTDNAAKYCHREGRIGISLQRDGQQAVLSVENEGPSLSQKDKQRVWEKFYRIGDEHTRSSTGTGLGLYLVRQIVRAHNGQASIEDRPGGGVIMEVRLPLNVTPT